MCKCLICVYKIRGSSVFKSKMSRQEVNLNWTVVFFLHYFYLIYSVLRTLSFSFHFTASSQSKYSKHIDVVQYAKYDLQWWK